MRLPLRKTGKIASAAGLLCAGLPALAQAQDASGGGAEPVPGVHSPPADDGNIGVQDQADTSAAEDTLPGVHSPPAEDGNLPPSSAPEVYYPADFAQYAPRNALDLIEQIPGFDVSGGGFGGGGGGGGRGNFNNGGGRGFGEASGNLLINGDRISSKSTNTRDQLQRIPVKNVIRIEIVDGATLDIPGLSGRVANIIISRGSVSGQYSYRPQWTNGVEAPRLTDGSVSLSGSTGALNYTVGLTAFNFGRGGEGISVFSYPDGTLDPRRNWTRGRMRRPSFTGIFAYQISPDVQANLNVTGGWQLFKSNEIETRLATNPLPYYSEQFGTRNEEWNYEIGGDIEFPLGPGSLKLIGLESYRHGDSLSTSYYDNDGTYIDNVWSPTSGSQFGRLSDTGERIGRAEYGWSLFGADWQLSAEAAFNRLDQVGSLFLYSPADDVFNEIPFPGGTGGVREDRYETILSFGRPITGDLSLQLQVGGEYSQISQTGDDPNSRTFRRPKGSVKLAWAPSSTLDVSLEVARRVGQLNFSDFLASVNLSDENENAGNNSLRPQQSWETQLELSKNFGSWGSATLRLFDHRIEDLVLIVPLDDGSEARGNLDKAHRYGLNFNSTLQLAPVGITGAKIDLRISAEDSSLIDPVTSLVRHFDGMNAFEIGVSFRHDIPGTDYGYGFEIRDQSVGYNYRVAEINLQSNPVTFGSVFVEHKDVFGLTVRARVGNIFDGANIYQRTVYAGPRDTAPVLFTEDKRTFGHQSFELTISGSF